MKTKITKTNFLILTDITKKSMIENIENPLMIFTAAIRKLFLPFNFALLLSVNKIQFSSEKAGCKKF